MTLNFNKFSDMKKYYVMAAAFAVLALSSCKKERTCTCGFFEFEIESSKKVAKAVCEQEGYEIIDSKTTYDGEELEEEDGEDFFDFDITCKLN